MIRARAQVMAIVVAGLAGWAALPALAQAPDPKADARAAETAEEKEEREGRKACAVALCSTFHNRKPDTGDVTCNVRKTWRKETIAKVLERGKIPWPWGYARCTSDLKFDRATLVKAMGPAEFEAQFDKHEVRCELEGEKDKYQVKLEIQPKVTFKDGKAVKASLNWGKIDAPTLAKSALWSATAADNSFGVLQSTVVDDINDFVQNKCLEVKDAWQGK